MMTHFGVRMSGQADGDQYVCRARTGDQAALEWLITRHYSNVRDRIALLIDPRWRSQISGEDVIQQTAIDAFLRIGTLRADSEVGFVAWFTSMARNNLIDAIRKLEADKRPPEHRRIAPSVPDSTMSLHEALYGVDSQTPSRIASKREFHRLVHAALERLPHDYRIAVQLYDLQGLQIDEVAGVMNRSPGSVHMLRNRAHELLREYLSK